MSKRLILVTLLICTEIAVIAVMMRFYLGWFDVT